MDLGEDKNAIVFTGNGGVVWFSGDGVDLLRRFLVRAYRRYMALFPAILADNRWVLVVARDGTSRCGALGRSFVLCWLAL